MVNFSVLPEGCISQILSMTSPRDACRSSAISSGFDAAANSDSVWEKFLPSDYRQIISRSVSPVVFSTKKQLYFSLCDSPLLLDGGTLSFALDRESGKKCYTLPAREVAIAWREDSRYWKWISLPESRTWFVETLPSDDLNPRGNYNLVATTLIPVIYYMRFPEVAQLLHVWWLDIWGRISTAMLSPNTTYTAYLIFKITDQRHTGLESLPLKASVRFVNGEDEYEDNNSSTIFLTLRTLRSVGGGQNGRLPQTRKDGWMEIELGEFYIDVADGGEVEMRLREVNSIKTGLIVEGIEVRPKVGV